MQRQIELIEVGPRDGLQNERRSLSLGEKAEFIARLVRAGVRRLEVGSFVHPKKVPQMADTEELISALPNDDDITLIGLVLNERGLDRALRTRAQEIGTVAVASDTFANKNQGQTAQESVTVAAKIICDARAEGRRANATLSAAFGCPFEGEIDKNKIVDMALTLAAADPHEIAIADTIGVADPWSVTRLVTMLREALPQMPLRAHFHNTRNTGLANAYSAVQAGITRLDASLGGIGGCPFAPAATGNIPTEDLIYMLERGGYTTDLDLPHLIEASNWLSATMAKPLPGMVSRAGQFPAKPELSKIDSAA